MIINNQEILETYWSSNTPNDVIQFLCDDKSESVDINPVKWTCGLIVTEDTYTKEIKLYFGMTEISSEGEDVEFILKYGQKLEGYSLENLSRLFNLNKKEK